MNERIKTFCETWGLNLIVDCKSTMLEFPINNNYADGIELTYFLDTEIYSYLTNYESIINKEQDSLTSHTIKVCKYKWVYIGIDSFYDLNLFGCKPFIDKEIRLEGNIDYFGPVSQELALKVIDYFNEHDEKRSGRLINCLPVAYSIKEGLAECLKNIS